MTSAIATAFARIALPFIVNDDEPETRAEDLGVAIAIALTELEHDEDLEPLDLVVGCLDHRVASFGLVVSDRRKLVAALEAAANGWAVDRWVESIAVERAGRAPEEHHEQDEMERGRALDARPSHDGSRR